LIIGLTISLVAIAVAAYLFFRNRSSEQIASIAVLPFQNSSADPDADYLSDGLAESLNYRLSQLPNLKVSPTSSVMRYKGKQSDVNAIASELGVGAVMTGRIAQRGDNLTISVELVDVRNKQLLWGEQYARKMSDLLTTQREIATEIVQKLRVRISGDNEKGLTKHYTENNDAYQLYLKGRFYWNRRTVEDDLKSLEYFHKAVEADPKFALAYVGISDARLMLGIPDALAGSVSPAETLGPARAAVERALELDPTLAEAYASRGHVRWKQLDWTGAESDFKRSIELNPNYSYSHLFYSLFLTFNGRMEEGLNESRRSVELDPFSVPINSNLAVVYYLARRPDDAIEAGRRAVELDSGIPIGHQRLGWAYEQKGMFPEAIAEFQAAVSQSNHVPLAVASLAHAYAISGNKAEAKRLFAELEQKSKKQFISPYLLAIIQVGLDQKQRAIELLEDAYTVNSIDLVQAKVDPKLDPLRGDPRFQELIKKIGFPE
jgi:TolB-like protein/Tfp pilus assembly protein PilF